MHVGAWGLALLSATRSLARNQLVAIQGLSRCRVLQKLDLSFNRIARVEGLGGLTSLRHLDLRANSIEV